MLRGSEGPGTVNGGDVQVSADSSSEDQCIVNSWEQAPTPVAFVSCANNTGQATDSAFTIEWVVA